MALIQSLLTEYGIGWAINRSLYSIKLEMMKLFPPSEKLFEKDVSIKRIDLFEFDLHAITSFLHDLPSKKQGELLSIADKALQGIITGFSSIELDYGNPINWHYNPLTKKKSSKDVKWYDIPDFDAELGDIKVVWEASRFTHFLYFSRAYLLTEDKKYYEGFSNQLEQWLRHNQYSYGANYKCGQECTLRMINALMAFAVFEGSGIASESDEMNIRKLVEVCFKKVLSNFFYAHKCIKNNHTFSEICGLIVGAWCCQDDFKVSKAYELLDKEIENQFFPDGGFRQYSFNYQRFTLQIIECILKISEKTGLEISGNSGARIKNSVLLMYQAQNDDGNMPNYGSNDGALIFPVTTCGYRDFRPVLNTIYALLEGNRLYDSGDYDEELLWFGGIETPVRKIERESVSFHDSGFYILRHNSGFLITYLQDYDSRPAHMDQLHVDLWHRGVNVFCDSGTYSYASELGKQLSATSGHNTAKVIGVEQMNRIGAFLVTDWTMRKDVEFDFKSFKGTMVSENGYEHTRIIETTKSGYAITDNVSGSADHCEFVFHTPCEVRLTSEGFELYNDGEQICIVETGGQITEKKVYRSLYYLKKEQINCISIRSSMNVKNCNAKFNIRLIG